MKTCTSEGCYDQDEAEELVLSLRQRRRPLSLGSEAQASPFDALGHRWHEGAWACLSLLDLPG